MKILHRNLDLKRTQTNYSKVAWFYNLWSKLTESKASDKVIELADIKNGQSIIELACGTGLVFKEILARNPDGHNIGIDLSQDMLSKARALIAKENFTNFELRQGNVFDLDIPDESFDKLINNFMIDLMPEDKFDDVLIQFHRLLKPEGVAIVSIFSHGHKPYHKFWRWMAEKFPTLMTDCRPVEIKENLLNAGFSIENEVNISQNTFPAKVYKLVK